MQTFSDCKDQVLRLGGPPALAACNTALGLGFNSISFSSPASSLSMASTPSNKEAPIAAATRNFGSPPNVGSHNKLDEGCARQALELLPLRPTCFRTVDPSSAPRVMWQPRPVASNNTSPAPRGIDMNQIPSSADCDDAAESSQTGVFSPFPTESVCRNDNGLSLKREREKTSDLEQDRTCEVSSRGSDEEEGTGTRKKLRLSKEQSALLEESFKEHSTLNPKQKNALARHLNLRPRQVEVWFQNRRARTKLKQTEVDCELLKRCCESLTEENRRLQKEVQELRALKVASPCVIAHDLYMPLPAATLTMCPSCERLATLDNRTLGFAKPQLPHHFTQPSAAC